MVQDPVRKAATITGSAGISSLFAFVAAAVSMVIFALAGMVLLAVLFAVLAAVNYVLATAGLMINPAVAVILVGAVSLIGVFGCVYLFCRVQLQLLDRFHQWGLRNRYPELTCLLAAWASIGGLMAAAWFASADLGDAGSQMMRGLSMLTGIAVLVVTPKFIIDANDALGRSVSYIDLTTFFLGPYPDRLESDGDLAGLIAALKHSNQLIRIRAVWALVNVADQQCVPSLERAYIEQPGLVSQAAAIALVKLGGEDAFNKLVEERLGSEINRLNFAAELLKHFRDMTKARRRVMARLTEISNNSTEKYDQLLAQSTLKELEAIDAQAT